MLNDFKNYPNIVATGPLLAYPGIGPLGRTVQHLGVVFNPWMRILHLYKGIPAASKLAHKRRFFQAITGACMVMPKYIFLEAGGFDENFINGFEDVDLCARLWNKGYRFTVNPESLVLHYGGSSAGRSANEKANALRLENGNLSLFAPDWHLKIEDDGLLPAISRFGALQEAFPEELVKNLDEKAGEMTEKILMDALKRYHFWEKGW